MSFQGQNQQKRKEPFFGDIGIANEMKPWEFKHLDFKLCTYELDQIPKVD